MDVRGTEAAGTADNDPAAIFFPFQDGARADAELSANVHGDGNLPLRGKLGVRDCHTLYYQGNGWIRQKWRGPCLESALVCVRTLSGSPRYPDIVRGRSEERRVGKEGRSRTS